jgi:hypothetical protein
MKVDSNHIGVVIMVTVRKYTLKSYKILCLVICINCISLCIFLVYIEDQAQDFIEF